MVEKNILELKKAQLQALASHRDYLRQNPDLHWLFFELTNVCNLNCAHCGSRCTSNGSYLLVSDVESTLKTIPASKPMICLTGGEPLLHPDFFEIADRVVDLGFHWGMTSNGTLINHAVAKKIRGARMDTISISIDGMETTHDRLRQSQGAWTKAVEGIKHLQDVGYSPQVTTVIHADNVDELDELFSFLCDLEITSWRPINVEPIGRACESGNMLLTASQFNKLLCFIQAKRYDLLCPMEVTYGCSHYLGLEMERMVRNNYFFCGAGIYIASVRCNGDICACLDIENLSFLVQGNIRRDNFWDVWCLRFKIFRTDRTKNSQTCASCKDCWICSGDSAHTWSWKTNEPLLCGKRMVLESSTGAA